MNYRNIKGFKRILRDELFPCSGFEHLPPRFRTSSGRHFFGLSFLLFISCLDSKFYYFCNTISQAE